MFEPQIVVRGFIDELDFVDGLNTGSTHIAGQIIPLGAPIRIRGWAIDTARGLAPYRIVLTLGAVRVEATCGDLRSDIAASFNADDSLAYGFSATIPTTGLVAGEYFLHCEVGFESTTRLYQFSPPIRTRLIAQTPVMEQSATSDFESIPFSIDSVIDLGRHGIERAVGDVRTVLAAGAMEVWGWIYDREKPIDRVALRINDIRVFGEYGFERPDVFEMFGTKRALRTGFALAARVDALHVGSHTMGIEYRTADGNWLSVPDRIKVQLLSDLDPFPTRLRCLLEPLKIVFDDARRSIEHGQLLSFSGTCAHDIDALYVRVQRVDDHPPRSPATVHVPLDFPINSDNGDNSKFGGWLDSREFSIGEYEVRFVGITRDFRAYHASSDSFRLEIISRRNPRERYASRQVRLETLGNSPRVLR